MKSSSAPPRSAFRRNEGYGLVVIAALFTAFAVVAAAYLDRSSAALEMAQQEQARTQLTRLTVALAKYARYHSSRFPCPASEQTLPSASTFGDAVAACHTGAAPAGTSFITDTVPAQALIRGMVPIKALVPYGVSYDDAFDPWGTRIVYIVHRQLTPSGTGGPITDAERPVLTEYNTNEIIYPPVDMLLVSFGRDRKGGYTRGQTDFTNPATGVCSIGTERRTANCDGDYYFTVGPLLMSSQAGVAQYFDDALSFYTATVSGSGGSGACTGTWQEQTSYYDDIGCFGPPSNTCGTSGSTPPAGGCTGISGSNGDGKCKIVVCGPGNFGRTTSLYRCMGCAAW